MAGTTDSDRTAAVGAPTDRERDYIAAMASVYGYGEEPWHARRVRAWPDAVQELSEHFPEDIEETAFHELSLLATADPADSTRNNQRQAAEIFTGLWPDQPNHPGLAHYLVHSLDYPGLADQGLRAARVCARIGPSSAHAPHMPSHIFTCLGLWNESIETNTESRDAARRLFVRTRSDGISNNEMHAQDYLACAYLQIDEQVSAQAVVAAAQVTNAEQMDGAGFALRAIPDRLAVKRLNGEAAASLELPGDDMPWERSPYVQANVSFARALGAARIGRFDEARAEVEKIRQVQVDLVESPMAGTYDWASNVESMRLAAAAWVAYAEGWTEDAVDLARAAADLDELTGKHPRAPGALLPLRELLADMLLNLNRPAEALIEYERSLREAPNRLNGLYGAARSAELSGSPEKAASYAVSLGRAGVPAASRRKPLIPFISALAVGALGLFLLLGKPDSGPLPIAAPLIVQPPSDRAMHEYMIADEARRVGLDTALALAISRWENPYSDPKRWSPNNCCVGLMQVNIPYWMGHFDEECDGGNLWHPRINACYGVRIFLWHLREEDSDTLRALAAYSGFARGYVRRVLYQRAALQE